MSPQRQPEETLEEMQERLAHLQRDYRDFIRTNSQAALGMWHDILVLQGKIEDELRAGLAPQVPSEALQSAAAVPSLSLVAPAVAKKPPPPPGKQQRKLPRPSLLSLPAGRPIESRHPFPNAVRHPKAWAIAHGLHYSAVKSWYTPGITWRPIPRKWAELLARDWGVPLKVWKGRDMRVINRRTGDESMVWREGISDDPRSGKPHPWARGARVKRVTP